MQKTISPALNRLAAHVADVFEARGRIEPVRAWEPMAVIALIGVGAFLRFWGLGSWGLEGDEKTMALPTMHLVQFGSPLMPSGMFYARAIGQLYLMAASVREFGQSEWAFRLPSVICGIALIGIAYFMGRRFLAPAWNMAFVAAVALLPALIADSQEARMYIFLVTCLAGYTALIFKWERSDSSVWFLAALGMMLVAIQFHVLAVFGSLLLLFPGLVAANLRKLWQGALGIAVAVAAFAGISRWIESFYIPGVKADPRHIAAAESHIVSLSQLHEGPWLLLAVVIVAALLAIYVARTVTARAPALIAGVLLFAGMTCELALFYHIGIVLLVSGAILAQRNGGRALRRVGVLVALSLALAAAQFVVLHRTTGESLHKTIGMMVGLPSIWSFLRATAYSPLAWLVVCVAVLPALFRVAQRRQIPDYWLFFALTVWLPLFGLGLFAWDVEPRYTQFALLPLLICAFAAAQEASAPIAARLGVAARPVVQAACATLAVVLFVNPVSLAHAVNAGYTIHPDHKGAAEYIRSIGTRPGDLIVAEDSLQQTYYLGHIDFWLRGMQDAAQFSYLKDGTLHDIYTDAPLIGDGESLLALVARRNRGTIYIIGSGEVRGEELPIFRSDGIFEALRRPIFVPIFLGRDGLTQIWKVSAPDADPAAAERSK